MRWYKFDVIKTTNLKQLKEDTGCKVIFFDSLELILIFFYSTKTKIHAVYN